MINRGFSLFEMIIVVGLIIVVSAIILPSYRGFGYSNDLSVAVNAVVQGLNQAQALARSGDGDSDWGIKIESGKVIIFKGSSFISFNAVSDQVFPIPLDITFSGLSQVIFAKFTGLPNQTGSVTLTGIVGNFAIITINQQGVVTF